MPRIPAMFIGELAKLTGASPKAIRLYESRGLLGTVRRRGSYRIYSDDDRQRVQIIRQALALGFRLSELTPMQQASPGRIDWQEMARILERKQLQIRQEILRLHKLDKQLGETRADLLHCLESGLPEDSGQCPAAALETGY